MLAVVHHVHSIPQRCIHTQFFVLQQLDDPEQPIGILQSSGLDTLEQAYSTLVKCKAAAGRIHKSTVRRDLEHGSAQHIQRTCLSHYLGDPVAIGGHEPACVD